MCSGVNAMTQVCECVCVHVCLQWCLHKCAKWSSRCVNAAPGVGVSHWSWPKKKKERKKERKIPTVLFTLIIFFVSLNVKMICCNTRVNEFIFCQQELNWTRLFLFYGRWIIQSWCLWSFGQRPNGGFFIIIFFKCSSFTADLNIYSVWWVGRQLHT